jgi:hypothetical protein
VLEGTKRETEAVERHRFHLQRSLDVLTRGAWVYGRTARGGEWFIRTGAIELRTASGAPVFLNAGQNFVVQHRTSLGGVPFRGYKAHTTGYAHSIGTVPDPDDALLEWHWHPALGPGYAHAHVNIRNEVLGNVGKLHLPTSRVYFEQIVAFLIAGLEVEPIDPNWRTVIKDVLDRVTAASTWRGSRP